MGGRGRAGMRVRVRVRILLKLPCYRKPASADWWVVR